MGPTCDSTQCRKWKARAGNSITHEERKCLKIFGMKCLGTPKIYMSVQLCLLRTRSSKPKPQVMYQGDKQVSSIILKFWIKEYLYAVKCI